MRSLRKRVLSWLLLIVMLATSMDLSVFARSDVEDTEYTSSSVSASQGMEETDSSQNSIDIPDTDVELSDEITRTYEGHNYRATFSVTSTWKSGVNIDVVIENTGSETIHDWYLSFDCYDEILNIWDATVYSHSVNCKSKCNLFDQHTFHCNC